MIITSSRRFIKLFGTQVKLPFVYLIFYFGSYTEAQVTMSTPKRYFINKLQDYDKHESRLKRDFIKKEVLLLTAQIESNVSPKPKNADGGLYVGIAGIAYMYFHLSRSSVFPERRDDFISKGLEYIKQSEKYMTNTTVRDPADITGFLLGGSGISAVAGCLYSVSGERNAMEHSLNHFVSAGRTCTPVHFLPYGGDEYLVGRAGYVSGALWLKEVFRKDIVPIDNLIAVCKSMFDSGIEYSKKHRSPCSLMFSYYDTEYLGAAHGLSSILQMMISVPEFLHAYPNTIPTIKSSIDYMLSLQSKEGNFPCAMDEIGRQRSHADELVHWCHGAPGVIYLMAKAYMVFNDTKYLEACLRSGELIWTKGLLKKGPGICHGVAGNGYAFLLLYRITGDKKHLHRAEQFANFLFTEEFKAARTPDSPYSLYEGLAGTVCYLADVLEPDKAAFPFMDVFGTTITEISVVYTAQCAFFLEKSLSCHL